LLVTVEDPDAIRARSFCGAGHCPSRDSRSKASPRSRRGLDADRATGAELLRPYFLGLLAEAPAASGHFEEAVDSVSTALEGAQSRGER
jgi:hypothetical protein